MPKKHPWLTIITSTCRQAQQPVYQNASVTTPPALHQHYPPPTSASFHLPFCRKRCHYCDFPIVALSSTNPTETDLRISNYIELLQCEIGSTRVKFGVCEGAEISMEMDPGTFDDGKVEDLVGLGVNRVSLGVQACQEE
uniref:Radical SAM core domain-containing protein n=1 Tax=Populus alba TaxID=43335 RepID=A0A4U5QDE0_POPAL|nr:hypothetical protein D5086_0000123460 [Populus alba]